MTGRLYVPVDRLVIHFGWQARKGKSMKSELFDSTTKEGKLLYAAICTIISAGPERFKGKDGPEAIAELQKTVDALKNLKM
jgi:hypothetical protein